MDLRKKIEEDIELFNKFADENEKNAEKHIGKGLWHMYIGRAGAYRSAAGILGITLKNLQLEGVNEN